MDVEFAARATQKEQIKQTREENRIALPRLKK